MIALTCEQGSPEWHAARRGIPTASQFHRILTPSRLEPSKSAGKYAGELLADWIKGNPSPTSFLGRYAPEEASPWIARGRELEPLARAAYADRTGADVEEIGFVYRDESRMVGASPDGMVGDSLLLEIKCPAPNTHRSYVAGDVTVPTRHAMQVQGQLWVTDRRCADFVSFCPEDDDEPLWIVRIARDERFMRAFDEHVMAFIMHLGDLRHTARRRGLVSWAA